MPAKSRRKVTDSDSESDSSDYEQQNDDGDDMYDDESDEDEVDLVPRQLQRKGAAASRAQQRLPSAPKSSSTSSAPKRGVKRPSIEVEEVDSDEAASPKRGEERARKHVKTNAGKSVSSAARSPRRADADSPHTTAATRRMVPGRQEAIEDNDDEEERQRKRKRAEMQRPGMWTTALGSQQQKEKLSYLQLMDMNTESIKLANENKINVRNAWQLNLLDYIDEVVDTVMSQNRNFQAASCTLDAGVKIYLNRVDAVAAETYRVLNGLTLADGRKAAASNGQEGEEGQKEPGAQQHKSKSKKSSHTLVAQENEETLNLKVSELQQHMSEPLFPTAAGSLIDLNSAKSFLVNNALLSDGCEFILDTTKVKYDCHSLWHDHIVRPVPRQQQQAAADGEQPQQQQEVDGAPRPNQGEEVSVFVGDVYGADESEDSIDLAADFDVPSVQPMRQQQAPSAQQEQTGEIEQPVEASAGAAAPVMVEPEQHQEEAIPIEPDVMPQLPSYQTQMPISTAGQVFHDDGGFGAQEFGGFDMPMGDDGAASGQPALGGSIVEDEEEEDNLFNQDLGQGDKEADEDEQVMGVLRQGSAPVAGGTSGQAANGASGPTVSPTNESLELVSGMEDKNEYAYYDQLRVHSKDLPKHGWIPKSKQKKKPATSSRKKKKATGIDFTAFNFFAKDKRFLAPAKASTNQLQTLKSDEKIEEARQKVLLPEDHHYELSMLMQPFHLKSIKLVPKTRGLLARAQAASQGQNPLDDAETMVPIADPTVQFDIRYQENEMIVKTNKEAEERAEEEKRQANEDDEDDAADAYFQFPSEFGGFDAPYGVDDAMSAPARLPQPDEAEQQQPPAEVQEQSVQFDAQELEHKEGEEVDTGAATGSPIVNQFKLVNKPKEVKKINVNVAKRAKKVDVRALKQHLLWNVKHKRLRRRRTLNNSVSEDEDTGFRQDAAPKSFSDMVQSIGDELPHGTNIRPSDFSDVSVPFCFVCMLHLCNENNLELQGRPDLSDFVIKMPQ